MKTSLLATILLVLSASAGAQTSAPATTTARNPLAGLLGGGLPSLGGSSLSNVAGLLGYCVKNNVVGVANAQSVLGTLTGKPGVATSPDFAAGQAGTIATGKSTASLGDLKGQVRTKVCSLVLNRAKAFL